MNGSVIREPSRSLKEQFSRSSEAWKEQSDPIFRFWAEGDWWGFPFFSLSASRYFGMNETLCLYWPLGTVVIAGPKVLDFWRLLFHAIWHMPKTKGVDWHDRPASLRSQRPEL
jgi:hypothetical protein